jgi:peptidoglycan/LPS O-acetylase OafA/YrhL
MLAVIPSSRLALEIGGAETELHKAGQHRAGGAVGAAQQAAPGGKEAFKKWPYRGDIDGLRAVAVVAVVLFHFGVDFPGGFTGVDVFFVISGYLITSIQLGRLQNGTFSMRAFWARRVRRLFWACAVMLVVVLVAAHYVLLAENYSSLLSQVTAVQLFGANIHYYLEQPYFFDHLEAPLLHCWSLAVEEQYYMLYPFLLHGVWWCTGGGDRGRRALLSSLVVIFIPAFALSIAWSGKTDSRGNFAFYLLPARAWEMALGGLLVALDHWRVEDATPTRRLAKAVVSWVGLGMVVASFWLFSAATPYPGSAALLPCLGTSMFIVASCDDGAQGRARGSAIGSFPSAGRLLALTPVASIGKISYSLYVWHWPIFVLLAYSVPGGTLSAGRTVGGLCASIAAAVLSYHFVENTSRNPQRVPDSMFWPASFTVWAALLVFASMGSGGIVAGKEVAMGFNATNATNATCSCTCNVYGGGRVVTPYMSPAEIDKMFDVPVSNIHLANILRSEPWSMDHFEFLGYHAMYQCTASGSCQRKDATNWNPVGGIVLFGDSHCLQWAPLLEELAVKYGRAVAFLCRGGLPVAWRPPSALIGASWGRVQFDKWKPDLVVFLYMHRFSKGGTMHYSKGTLEQEVQNVLSTNNAKLVLFGDIPFYFDLGSGDTGAKRYAQTRFEAEGSWEFLMKLHESCRDLRLAENVMFQSIAEANPGRVSVADLAPYYINDNTQFLQLVDPYTGRLDYKDRDHVNDRGSRRAGQLFRWRVFGDWNCSGTGNVPTPAPTPAPPPSPPWSRG